MVIATPDHTHAVTAAAAMELRKHVYLQKPLTHTVWESRYLTYLARKTSVVAQMGNEGHPSDIGHAASLNKKYSSMHRGRNPYQAPQKLDYWHFTSKMLFKDI